MLTSRWRPGRRLVAPARGPRRTAADATRRAVRFSFGFALALLLIVGVVAGVAAYVIAGEEVSDDAVQTANRLAESGVGPPLQAALAGDPVARAQLDAVVAARLSDGAVSQITVWTPDGVVLYSSNAAIVGRRAFADTPYRTALARGEFSEIDSPDLEFGDVPRAQRVVEVDVPIPASGNRLVLELHYGTAEYSHQVLVVALPLLALSVLPLLLLQATQGPVVISLLRRVRGYERQRAVLAEGALTASERERGTIAAGVHDTVVQDLAGASYALAALERHVDPDHRAMAATALGTIRTSVESLRGLLVELYPAALTATALPGALANLLAGLRRGGLATTSVVEVPDDLDDATAVLLYRVATEAITAIVTHARSCSIDLTVSGTAGACHLHVTDDGGGLPPDVVEDGLADDGSGGLHLLRDRVADVGGHLEVVELATGGTQLRATLPTHVASTA